MDWIFITLRWYFVLFLLGAIFFPLAKKIFGRFFIDLGYPFAKTLGILALTYGMFVIGVFKISPFTDITLLAFLGIFLVLNVFIFKKTQKTPLSTETVFLIVFEELLFVASLFFWVYVRGQEPSIRGLEKFMDFGFINSALRSNYFPPLDIWLSADPNSPGGYPINYYYFGHLTGAVLIKLSGVKASIGYNLILASIFALTVSQAFSLAANVVYAFLSRQIQKLLPYKILGGLIFFGLLGSFIVSLGGNLHTIYAFTSGYPNENPVPFWNILKGFNPSNYWYPNATRFIPFTIHEFPSYSWVVADVHGHVYDIPFVLLTLAILLIFFIKHFNNNKDDRKSHRVVIFLGFLTAVHYMTNAWDGAIYILLSLVMFFVIYKFSVNLLRNTLLLVGSFIFFSLPFSLNFSPFVTGIGVNCSPEFLINLRKLGPFIFEKGHCQVSPLWMLFVLWGFFWISFIIFLLVKRKTAEKEKITNPVDLFMLIIFLYGTFLVIIPEFFYFKDIYPAHFRANTMFKFGYQAFIMMGIASAYTFSQIRSLHSRKLAVLLKLLFIVPFFFVAIYPFFSIPSYYGELDRPVEVDGAKWLKNAYPEDKEIIDYLNAHVKNQPVILEAQGDSYTDFERISAYTGLPTVAGWWVHEWLWRGSSDVVGKRIPEIVSIYESDDLELTKQLLKKYRVSYIVISKMEREKYTKLRQDKFESIAKKVFVTKNGFGALYKVDF